MRLRDVNVLMCQYDNVRMRLRDVNVLMCQYDNVLIAAQYVLLHSRVCAISTLPH